MRLGEATIDVEGEIRSGDRVVKRSVIDAESLEYSSKNSLLEVDADSENERADDTMVLARRGPLKSMFNSLIYRTRMVGSTQAVGLDSVGRVGGFHETVYRAF